MKFIRDLFTESDNTTWDLGRVQATAAFGSVLLMMAWVYIVRGQTFDALAVCGGVGGMMAAYGAMIKLKGSEPSMPPVAK